MLDSFLKPLHDGQDFIEHFDNVVIEFRFHAVHERNKHLLPVGVMLGKLVRGGDALEHGATASHEEFEQHFPFKGANLFDHGECEGLCCLIVKARGPELFLGVEDLRLEVFLVSHFGVSPGLQQLLR
jgi:hypothetical protein